VAALLPRRAGFWPRPPVLCGLRGSGPRRGGGSPASAASCPYDDAVVVGRRRKEPPAVPADGIHRLGVATEPPDEAAVPPVPDIDSVVLTATSKEV